MEVLFLEQKLACPACFKLGLPRIDDSLHFLNVGNEHRDVFRVVQIQDFQLASCLHHLVFKDFHFDRKFRPELRQDFFVQLGVLTFHLPLHSLEADLEASKAFEIFTGVESLSTLFYLIKDLVPLCNVVSQHIENLVLFNVPKGLVRLPSFVIFGSLIKDLLEYAVGNLHVKFLTHLENQTRVCLLCAHG